jgi:hypothetical protein
MRELRLAMEDQTARGGGGKVNPCTWTSRIDGWTTTPRNDGPNWRTASGSSRGADREKWARGTGRLTDELAGDSQTRNRKRDSERERPKFGAAPSQRNQLLPAAAELNRLGWRRLKYAESGAGGTNRQEKNRQLNNLGVGKSAREKWTKGQCRKRMSGGRPDRHRSSDERQAHDEEMCGQEKVDRWPLRSTSGRRQTKTWERAANCAEDELDQNEENPRTVGARWTELDNWFCQITPKTRLRSKLELKSRKRKTTSHTSGKNQFCQILPKQQHTQPASLEMRQFVNNIYTNFCQLLWFFMSSF